MKIQTNCIKVVLIWLLLALLTGCTPAAFQEQPTETPNTPEPTETPLETIVVHNGMVITATGEDPIPDGVVVIDGGLITAIGSKDEVAIPENATLIDANGGTILPGIIDAHTHLLGELVIEDGRIDKISRTLYLTRPLQAGVTTIRDVGSPWGDTMNLPNLRSALEKLGNAAPNVVLTGPLLTAPKSFAIYQFPDQSLAIDSVESAREITSRLLDAGVDQIKILSDDSSGEEGTRLTPEQIQAIIETAHARGLWVTMHASIEDAKIAVSYDVDELAHWPIGPNWPEPQVLPDELFEQLIAKNIPVVTTFNITKPAEGDVRRFLDDGGTLVFGTDGPGTGPVDNPYREMSQMAFFGELTPMEIILAATANAAEAVGLGDKVGTLEVGKMADIIILDGNPLNDLRVFRDGVVVVIKGGELIPLEP